MPLQMQSISFAGGRSARRNISGGSATVCGMAFPRRVDLSIGQSDVQERSVHGLRSSLDLPLRAGHAASSPN